MKLRLWLMAAGLVAAAYFMVFGGEYSLFDVHRIQDRRQEAVTELRSLRAEVDSMRHRAERLSSDPDAIERIARERYGMIREDERLYRFIEEPDSAGMKRQPETAVADDPPNH